MLTSTPMTGAVHASAMQSERIDDVALTRAVAAGDRQAAERFARRLLPVVRRVSRTVHPDRGEADDAAQNALVELLGAAKGFEGRASLESWAYRIAVRVCMRGAKKYKARRERVNLVEQAPPQLPASVDEERLRERLPRELQAYLEQLKPAQREALLLRHALGHTVPEIAELTGAPVPTVKSRLVKAQSEIRRLIRQDLAVRTGARQSERRS